MKTDEKWMRRVLQEHALWCQFGLPPWDPREALPKREYEAHLAILEGKQREREKQERKMQQEANKAKSRGHAGGRVR